MKNSFEFKPQDPGYTKEVFHEKVETPGNVKRALGVIERKDTFTKIIKRFDAPQNAQIVNKAEDILIDYAKNISNISNNEIEKDRLSIAINKHAQKPKLGTVGYEIWKKKNK